MSNLPIRLLEMKEEIEGYAKGYGLDFFETIFEVVDYKTMNAIAAYGGFPTRYNHWRFGMEYEQLSKSYEYGLSKIYEMVINTNPSYAYLLEGNSLVEQKIVMAHVYAHVDFFKNNYFFSKTNRRMVDAMANHATRVRRYIDRYGLDVVEDFIETCLSVDNLIDYHAPFITRRKAKDEQDEPELNEMGIPKLPTTKDYMEEYINPAEFLEEQRARQEAEKERRKRNPEYPEKDVLTFLIHNAPLERWEADILSMVRAEAYYFAPQAQTKIMNEGWASYWHSRIMTEKALKASEIIDYAESNANVMATSPGNLNPYKLGVELWRNIQERWDRGQFGKEWEECDDLEKRVNWDRQLGKGMEKIFQVRKLYNDVTFIDEFLTEEFCREQKLLTFAYNTKSDQYEIASREFREVKEKILFSITNFGQPFIYVTDSNFQNRSELLLQHKFDGQELRLDYARDVLKNLFRIWKRPVNILTIVEGKGRVFTYDGSQHREHAAEYEAL